MNILLKILEAFPLNGKKFNTGTIVALAGLLIQNIFNVSHDEAVQTVTLIMEGVGGVYALIGYIHGWMKDKKK